MSCSNFILGRNAIYQIWQDLINPPVRLCGCGKVCNIAKCKSSCKTPASHSWVNWRIWKPCYHSPWTELAKAHHSLSARRFCVILFLFPFHIFGWAALRAFIYALSEELQASWALQVQGGFAVLLGFSVKAINEIVIVMELLWLASRLLCKSQACRVYIKHSPAFSFPAYETDLLGIFIYRQNSGQFLRSPDTDPGMSQILLNHTARKTF